jgi:ATP-dependent exoDNAse (exonuclease V) alpha subunit
VLAAARGRAITVIQGAAGAGKTELLKQVVAAAKQADMNVLALTRNAIIAQELGEQLGVESHTLKWLDGGSIYEPISKILEKTERSTLLIMDEAGVADQHDWDSLLHIVTKNRNVQLVAVGDRLQTQSIDGRASFGVVINAIQSSEQGKHLFVDMKTSIRCKEWHEEHDLLRQGSTQAAEKAAKEGRIAAVEKAKGVEKVADLVMERIEQGEDVLAVAVSNPEAAAIAVAIQDRRDIKRDERTQLRWEDQKTGVGDFVRTRKNERQKGILNGDVWTVRAIDDKGLTLQRKIGKKEDGPKTWVSHEWAQKHLELAYAATIDLTQGMTVDRAIVKVSDSIGISRLYAGATRGRQPPIFVAEYDRLDPRPNTTKGLEAVQAAIERNDVDPTVQEMLTEHREWEEAEQERRKAEQERQRAEEQSYRRSRSSSPSQAPSRGPVRQLKR